MGSQGELAQPAHDSLALVLTGILPGNCLLPALPTNPHSPAHPTYFQPFLISSTFLWNQSPAQRCSQAAPAQQSPEIHPGQHSSSQGRAELAERVQGSLLLPHRQQHIHWVTGTLNPSHPIPAMFRDAFSSPSYSRDTSRDGAAAVGTLCQSLCTL